MFFTVARSTNISARMRAHYNSATCNAKPLCLSAIVNVRCASLSFLYFFCFFSFFARGHVLFTRGVATRENGRWERRGDSVTKPEPFVVRLLLWKRTRSLPFDGLARREKPEEIISRRRVRVVPRVTWNRNIYEARGENIARNAAVWVVTSKLARQRLTRVREARWE